MNTKPHDPTQPTWLSKNLGMVLIAIGAVGLTMAIVVLAVYAAHFSGPMSTEAQDWGPFGDFFGGTLNPIFAFLGLIALLLTLSVQSRELELSRVELVTSREQLARSAEAQERSEAALTKQAALQDKNLEATIIQLKITSLQASLKALDFQAYEVNETGRPKYARNVDAVVKEMNRLVAELETVVHDG